MNRLPLTIDELLQVLNHRLANHPGYRVGMAFRLPTAGSSPDTGGFADWIVDPDGDGMTVFNEVLESVFAEYELLD